MSRALVSIGIALGIAFVISVPVAIYFKVPCANSGEFCVSEPLAVAGYLLLMGALLVALGWIAGVYEMKPK